MISPYLCSFTGFSSRVTNARKQTWIQTGRFVRQYPSKAIRPILKATLHLYERGKYVFGSGSIHETHAARCIRLSFLASNVRSPAAVTRLVVELVRGKGRKKQGKGMKEAQEEEYRVIEREEEGERESRRTEKKERPRENRE